MSELEGHIRFMEKFMKANPDATIKDYFEVTDGLLPRKYPKVYVTEAEIEEAIKKIDLCLNKSKTNSNEFSIHRKAG